ncbi:hypothetical protein D918_02936 [Trichuris suis]|nr:hypothetical protein D918_02936 [Trichuris suis]
MIVPENIVSDGLTHSLAIYVSKRRCFEEQEANKRSSEALMLDYCLSIHTPPACCQSLEWLNAKAALSSLSIGSNRRPNVVYELVACHLRPSSLPPLRWRPTYDGTFVAPLHENPLIQACQACNLCKHTCVPDKDSHRRFIDKSQAADVSLQE